MQQTKQERSDKESPQTVVLWKHNCQCCVNSATTHQGPHSTLLCDVISYQLFPMYHSVVGITWCPRSCEHNMSVDVMGATFWNKPVFIENVFQIAPFMRADDCDFLGLCYINAGVEVSNALWPKGLFFKKVTRILVLYLALIHRLKTYAMNY